MGIYPPYKMTLGFECYQEMTVREVMHITEMMQVLTACMTQIVPYAPYAT